MVMQQRTTGRHTPLAVAVMDQSQDMERTMMARRTALVVAALDQEPQGSDRMLHAASDLLRLARCNERHNYHKIPGQGLAEHRTAGTCD